MNHIKPLLQRTLLKSPPFVAAACLCAAVHTASAATEQWQGQPNVSATLNWTDAANWTGPKQSYYNQVQFTGVGAKAPNDFSVNCILDATTGVAQMPIWELDYLPVNGNYTTLINPGVTLRTGAGYGSMFVGADVASAASSPAPVDAQETISFTGDGGTLTVVNTLYVGQGSSQSDNHNVTLDLSGLGNFQIQGVSGSRLLVGVTRNNVPHSQGTVYLARTNNISLGSDFQIGYNPNSSNSRPSAVYLGLTNAISTGGGNNYLIVGNSGCTNASLTFNPAFLNTGTAPSAYFGSTAASTRGNWWIGSPAGGQVAGYGLCDFTDGYVTVMADAMLLGRAGDTTASSATGVLTFDNGTINANTLVSGYQSTSSGGAGVGIINVNSNAQHSATLVVGMGLTLASVTGTPTLGTAGTLNINGGTVVASGITNGGGLATISLNKGTLTIGTVAGTTLKPIDSFTTANSLLNLTVVPTTTNVVVTSLITGGTTNAISITSVPPVTSLPARIPLITYSGTIGGAGYNFGLSALPPLCSGYLQNDTANSSVVLVLTSAPRTLTWSGNINGNWDIATANWLAGGSSLYRESDFVQFLDSASTKTVQLASSVSPGGLLVSNTASYTFAGSGFISGSSGLIKQGSGTLLFDNSGVNNFSGDVSIQNGALQIGNNDASGNLPAAANVNNNGTLIFDRSDSLTVGNAISGSGSVVQEGGNSLVLSGANTFAGTLLVTNHSTLKLGSGSALGSTSGGTIIANGSTLDANGSYLGAEPLTVSGAGVDGTGAVVNSGGGIYGLVNSLTLAGDTTFNCNSRWDLSSAVLSSGGHPYSVTLAGMPGVYFQWSRVTADSSLADINLSAGNFGVIGSTTLGDPNRAFYLAPDSYLIFYADDTSVGLNKQIVDDGATIQNA